MFARGRTATIVRANPGGTDQFGDPVTGTTVEITVPGAAWAPRTQGVGPSAGEVHDRGRQGVIEGLTVYLPYGTDLHPSDQLRLDGRLYEVEGDPGEWWNPMSGRLAGLEVAVRRAEG
jgi:hypothetical protein